MVARVILLRNDGTVICDQMIGGIEDGLPRRLSLPVDRYILASADRVLESVELVANTQPWPDDILP